MKTKEIKYTVTYKTKFEYRSRTKKVDAGKNIEETKSSILSSLTSEQYSNLVSVTFSYNNETYIIDKF